MVAEPVGVALTFLQKSYLKASDAVSEQLTKVSDTVYGLVLSIVGWDNDPLSADKLALIQGSDKWSGQMERHKYEIAAFGMILGLGVVGCYQYRMRTDPGPRAAKKRRRVPKLANGARKDVVLVVGLPTEPFTRLMALDFEKRGFIVYLTILDDTDYKYTQSNPITDDINFLNLSGGVDLGFLMAKFHQLLQVPVVPIKGAEEHLLRLSAVVFAPNLYFPLGPLENFSPASWERVMSRMNLYTRLLSLGFLQLVRHQLSKVIVIIPNIVSTLGLPYHGPETVFQNGVKDLFLVLAKEVSPHGVSVTQIRLGNLNLSALSPKTRVPAMIEAEIRSWNDDLQSLYGVQFLKQQGKTAAVRKPLALLTGFHHLLFDIIFTQGPTASVAYYGTGARTYERLSSVISPRVLQMFM